MEAPARGGAGGQPRQLLLCHCAKDAAPDPMATCCNGLIVPDSRQCARFVSCKERSSTGWYLYHPGTWLFLTRSVVSLLGSLVVVA
ncbi:uncharacterized protein N7483_012828 [Penicillium malachiteum]|uniref:uncharacterized protein n=1 Tax=Penicillium malachiteum TaxID=1324776 RepID=UPI0025468807|nr:uncharacterized protein N7483_012828 [Penicillium malachiteum]KAJ5715647.1 hypothetical protein N7483_012828 [Penicillium malachiteum]